ncbi:DUF1453 domain-containing protein [Streptomyces sp. NPDC056580]|uniref:DUF1453 domain-containing protein n=1 Tax=Streptomyces sp. NPDC056580 TaxID=3345872 RepID=UPI0036BDF167
MSGFVNALVIVAVVAVVIVRQFRARAISTDRRWWLLPVILAVVTLREPGILDDHRPTASVALLAVELLIAAVTGAGWAWTTRIWTEPDGAVWTRGTKAGAAVWIAGIALRAGVFALGVASGVHQDGSALVLGLAAMLLVRAGVVNWRAQSLGASDRPAPAYGHGMRLAWKERV